MDAPIVTPGKLKLKGAPLPAAGKKHKKTKKSKEPSAAAAIAENAATEVETAPQPVPQPRSEVPYTQAELNLMVKQAKMEKDRVKKVAAKTHRERVEELNKKLEAMSEHHDIPKVGPG